MGRITSVLFGSTLRIVLTAVVGIAVVVGGTVAVGVLGAPAVAGVQNQFGAVTEDNTTIGTNLTVRNPNPVGVQLGDTAVNYTVYMNDVRMASGQKSGLQVGTGNSTLNFTTRMDNGQIPPWWTSHIENGERTQVSIDARVTSTLTAGQTVQLQQDRTVETDLIGQFNSDEDRPVDANRRVVSDPVLWVNGTRASWDRENLSPEQTPLDLSFDVYNPKPYPYAVSELGYTITMNGIEVGTGSTDDVATLPPGTERTIDTRTILRNQHLDEWWVSHLQNNQVTDLRMQFYVVVDPVEEDGLLGSDPVGEFRVPLEPIDYQRTVETDIFGTKPTNETASNEEGGSETADDDSDTATETATATPTETATDTATDTPTEDDGLLGGSGGDSTATETPADETTGGETATATETPTDDGGLLG
jgi:LEA14-like dessication related protein